MIGLWVVVPIVVGVTSIIIIFVICLRLKEVLELIPQLYCEAASKTFFPFLISLELNFAMNQLV